MFFFYKEKKGKISNFNWDFLSFLQSFVLTVCSVKSFDPFPSVYLKCFLRQRSKNISVFAHADKIYINFPICNSTNIYFIQSLPQNLCCHARFSTLILTTHRNISLVCITKWKAEMMMKYLFRFEFEIIRRNKSKGIWLLSIGAADFALIKNIFSKNNLGHLLERIPNWKCMSESECAFMMFAFHYVFGIQKRDKGRQREKTRKNSSESHW